MPPTRSGVIGLGVAVVRAHTKISANRFVSFSERLLSILAKPRTRPSELKELGPRKVSALPVAGVGSQHRREIRMVFSASRSLKNTSLARLMSLLASEETFESKRTKRPLSLIDGRAVSRSVLPPTLLVVT